MVINSKSFRLSILFTVCSYVVWFLCVTTAARGPGPASVGMTIAFLISLLEFFIYIYSHQDRRLFYTTIILMVGIGFIVDTCALLFNLVTFSANHLAPFSPIWVSILWFNLSMCCHVLLKPYYQKTVFIAAGTFIGILIGYGFGALLGAAQLHYGVYSLLYYAVSWAIIMPLLFLLLEHLAQISSLKNNNNVVL